MDDRKNVIKQVHPDLQLASTTVRNPAVQPAANFDWNLCVIRNLFPFPPFVEIHSSLPHPWRVPLEHPPTP